MSDKMPRGRTKSVSDAQLLDVAKNVLGPAFTAGEVAAEVEIGKEAARNRLDELVEAGQIAKKSASGMNIYWFQDPAESANGVA
jgi:predicted ArsR family transcriptional regulator